MLTFIPIILLVFFAILIQFLGRYRLSTGSTWLVTAGSALLVWFLTIIFRVFLPEGYSIATWSPLGIGSDLLLFQFIPGTWVFSFLLVSLLIVILFTDTIRLAQGDPLITWTGAMILTAVSLFSIASQTILTVVITWSIIDVVEIWILTRINHQEKIQNSIVVEFSTRMIGTFLVICALVFSKTHDPGFSSFLLSENALGLILIGVLLRLGVFPLHLPFMAQVPVRRSIGTLLRFVSPVSVFAFLSQLQPPKNFTPFLIVVFVFLMITTFYGAIKWLSARDELSGRPFWIMSFSGLIIISFLRGQNESVLALTMIMIVCGSASFLLSLRGRTHWIYMLILLLSSIGFPYTPLAPIWKGLAALPLQILNPLILISLGLNLFGLVRFAFRASDLEQNHERWMLLFYWIGMALLFLVPWIAFVWRFKMAQEFIDWYGPGICALGIGLFLFFDRIGLGRKILDKGILNRFYPAIGIMGRFLCQLFQFEWFVNAFRSIYELLFRLSSFLTEILEGDGGLLWGLLFLALVSSVVIGTGVP
ncbi:MAG: hypothetical protein NTZ74_09015 [Chloroflexi bacterium]|nr:hypothetical protein [Chloroflexota bacterium]